MSKCCSKKIVENNKKVSEKLNKHKEMDKYGTSYLDEAKRYIPSAYTINLMDPSNPGLNNLLLSHNLDV